MDPDIISDKVIDLVGRDLNEIRTAFYRFVEEQGWRICGSGGGMGTVDVSFYLNGRHYWVDIRLAAGQESIQ